MSQAAQPFLTLTHPFPIYNAADCWALNATRKVILFFVGLNKRRPPVRGAETWFAWMLCDSSVTNLVFGGLRKGCVTQLTLSIFTILHIFNRQQRVPNT